MSSKQKQKRQTQRLARESLRTEGFLSVNRGLLQKVGPALAIYISNLADSHQYFDSYDKLYSDGSFFLTHEDQMRRTGMSESQLRRCKEECKRLGIIIETKMRGVPAKEFYVIDFEKAVRLAVHESAGLAGHESAGLYIHTKDNHTKDNNSMAKAMVTRSASGKSPSTRHHQLSRLLQTAIERRRKINKTINLGLWPSEIQKLCKSLDEPKAESRVRRVIKFLDRSYAQYGIQSERHYIPTVESVRTLREKFSRIEDAMAREEQSGHRIIAREGGEVALEGGEPGLDSKWFPVEDQKIGGVSIRVWENANGDRVACDAYPQPDPEGPILGTPVTD